MKKIYLFLFIIILTANSLLISQPFLSWEWQNPYPQGNTIRASEFISPLIGFAVTDNSILMRTLDGGLTWTSHSPSLGLAQFNDLDFTDSITGYIACNSGQIYKSINGGLTWMLLTTGVSANLKGIAFANSLTGYACGDNKTIIKTSDGGVTWLTQIISDTNAMNMNDIKLVNADTGYMTGRNVNYTAGVVPVYKTTNGGINWIRKPDQPFILSTGLFLKDSNTVFVHGHFGAIHRTTDGGQNWASVNYHAYASVNTIQFINDSVGFAAGSDRYTLRTTNNGASWLVINDSAFKNLNYYTIAYNGLQKIQVMGTNGEITESSDNGNQWSIYSRGVRFNLRNLQFFDGTSGYASGDNRIFLKTSNAGLNWQTVSVGNNGIFWSMHFINENTGYCGFDLGQIAKTTNGGLNWTFKQTNQTRQMHAIHFTSDSVGHAAGQNNYYYRTTNAGGNWNQIFIDSGNWVGLHSDFHFMNTNTGYLSNTNGSIYSTTNAGSNWSKTSVVNDSIWGFNCIAFADSVVGFAAGFKGRIAKTTNMGTNWTLTSLDTSYRFTEIFLLNSSIGFISGRKSGGGGVILKTTNGGENWIEQITYTSSQINHLYFTSESQGFAVGDNGTILRTLTAGEHPIFTGITNNQNDIIPKEFILFQNYPNPFNPVTNIKFMISSNSKNKYTHTRLSIYNSIGQKVETLIDEVLPAGTHEITWNASRFASGVYFYQLSIDDISETKKMILIK